MGTRKDASASAKRQRSSQRVSGGAKARARPLAELYAGRDQGEAMLYDPNATQRYKSEEVRYQAAIALTPEVMRNGDSGGYRVASSGRSTAGYWSPGVVRLYCPCAGEAEGKILELDLGGASHDLVIRTSGDITLMRWTNAPNCEFSDPGLEPLGTLTPDDGTVRFSVPPVGFYSLEQGGGCVVVTPCMRIVNLDPAATIIQAI